MVDAAVDLDVLGESILAPLFDAICASRPLRVAGAVRSASSEARLVNAVLLLRHVVWPRSGVPMVTWCRTLLEIIYYWQTSPAHRWVMSVESVHEVWSRAIRGSSLAPHAAALTLRVLHTIVRRIATVGAQPPLLDYHARIQMNCARLLLDGSPFSHRESSDIIRSCVGTHVASPTFRGSLSPDGRPVVNWCDMLWGEWRPANGLWTFAFPLRWYCFLQLFGDDLSPAELFDCLRFLKANAGELATTTTTTTAMTDAPVRTSSVSGRHTSLALPIDRRRVGRARSSPTPPSSIPPTHSL